MSERFPCTECGLCCRHVGLILATIDQQDNPLLKELFKSFPYETDAFGACEKLIDNRCSIYEDRPLVCNVAAMADTQGIPRTEYFKKAAQACNFMIKNAGLDESFLINEL